MQRYLEVGDLPKAYVDGLGWEYLVNYVDTYLREEIYAESLVPNLANYSRFLEAAGFGSDSILNFTKIANDAQLPVSRVRDYYQILEDTLVGCQILQWQHSRKRKAVSTAKFYFFDIGVANAISGIRQLSPGTEPYGRALEHLVAQEIYAYLSYRRIHEKLYFWRSKHQHEVDFIIGDDVAIEVKGKLKATQRDHKGLIALLEEKTWKHALLVSLDSQPMIAHNGIRPLHLEDFFRELSDGKIIEISINTAYSRLPAVFPQPRSDRTFMSCGYFNVSVIRSNGTSIFQSRPLHGPCKSRYTVLRNRHGASFSGLLWR